jgi:DNA replication protein DnaC
MLIHPTIEKLHALRLSGMAKALQQQLTDPDVKALSFEDRFGLLVDAEDTERGSRRLRERLKASKMKEQACAENVDVRHLRGLDKALVKQLAAAQWIVEHRNVLIVGPTGVGKTYLACSLIHSACRHGFRALYARTQRLLQDLTIARADGSYRRLLNRLAKLDLLVLDDFGLAALPDETSRDLLEVIDDRSGTGSTIITSQLPIDHWHQTIANPTIADAILDRVVHNSYKLNLKGESLRKRTTPDTNTGTQTEF